MSPSPRTRWVSAAAFVALAAGTVRARVRLRALPVLALPVPAPVPSPYGEPAGPAGPGEPAGAGGPEAPGEPAAPVVLVAPDAPDAPDAPADPYRLLTAEGVVASPDVLRAACAHAAREGLRVLELVPRDLDAERALGLLRLVDPAAYRRDRLGAGRGAGYALLATEEVLARAGADPDAVRSVPELLSLGRRLKEYAADATDLAAAPGLRAPAPVRAPGRRVEELYAQGLPPGALTAAQLAGLALLAVGAVRHGRWGAAAAALYWAQPYLVLGTGGPLRPAGLGRATAARPLRALRTGLRAVLEVRVAGAVRGALDAHARAGRAAEYAAELAGGTGRFFEPRRTDCPWCGRADGLSVRVRVPDLLQGKPGLFTLEECGACGHVFQNPRLSGAGLDFYYRDFYDGTGREGAGTVFGRLGPHYRARAEMLRPFASPVSWLDVGTGHGHFCLVAGEVWPDTVFDGLDMGDGVREAERRGWVGTGYQGQLPELAGKLAGQYEAVSMYHYLEHTQDPFAELDAAAAVLVPGGHLLVEVPDPGSRMARLLGAYWLPWFQPQHQHLVPAANLRRALAERGFTVVAEEHGRAHQHNDFVGAVALAVNRLAPDPDAPWATGPPPGLPRRAARLAVRTAAVPCLAAAAALDLLRSTAARRTNGGNAYRLAARLDAPTGLAETAGGGRTPPTGGADRPTGPAGSTGPASTAGTADATGTTGAAGAAGTADAIRTTGPSAAADTTGTAGAADTAGVAGTAGRADTAGAAGTADATGTAGAAGTADTADATGTTARAGAAIATGTADAPGTTGMTGAAGTADATGTTDTAGTANGTGTAGTTGAADTAGAAATTARAGTAAAAGTADATGTTGTPGTAGMPGTAGAAGAAGGAGPAGAAATTGRTGTASAASTVDATDTTSPAGTADATGTTGTAGAAGTVGGAEAAGPAGTGEGRGDI